MGVGDAFCERDFFLFMKQEQSKNVAKAKAWTRMTQVKICGIKNQEGIEIVNRHRPDYIGFVFAESRRRVTHEESYVLRRLLAEGI